MRLLEHQAKELLAEAGLSVPRGALVTRAEDVPDLAEEYGPGVVVKAQIRAGGRGKAGGILTADGPTDARLAAEQLLGSELKGERVEAVLVEERAEAASELYLAVLTDREAGRPLVLLRRAGGVDVESAAAQDPSTVARVQVDMALGLFDYQVRYLVNRAGLPTELVVGVADAVRRLEHVYRRYDALLAEINPLAVLADERVVALDARVEVDDNALFRQPRIAALRALSPRQARIEAAGFHFIEMEGSVGLISTGSGACMALMDLLAARKLGPANFMELGQSMGTGGAEVATEVLLENSRVEALLVAGYSGGPLDKLAGGVLQVLAQRPKRAIPVVLSLQGRNDSEAMRLVAESNDPRVHAVAGYEQAVDRMTELIGCRVSGLSASETPHPRPDELR
jgi:succinyl-CoA synthetase beta subunit